MSIVAHYIKERTKNAQFVIISLRNNMFELADRLVGIYKTNNATKSITVNPHVMAAMHKAGIDIHKDHGKGQAHAAPSAPMGERTNQRASLASAH